MYYAIRELVTLFLLVVPHASQGQTNSKVTSCTTVRGRYGIYAENDFLWIYGSKHLIEVTNEELDRQLQKRGWERTYAIGLFTICTVEAINPTRLTVRDRVELRSYSGISYRSR